MTAKHLHFTDVMSEDGVSAITVADERWARRDIKTIQLLANCRAKQKAAEQGAYEAILVMPDGSVSEGSSSNVWIVSAEGELVTREASHDILNGITRRSVAQVASERQMKIVNRNFTVADMLNAKEVFVTSATSVVTPITKIDDTVIANGKMGSLSKALRADYLEKTPRVLAR
jgi:D-alanine transaminase